MDDIIFMHVLDALANLPHKKHAVSFGQSKVICHDSLEKFATGNAVERKQWETVDKRGEKLD